ncbi:Hypothetical_protein [Hexamita inflata]|uniref:Hypothetical_protein n=1 Tax=Hexamita inflata TaxID=28002 RepID=A0ABP1GYM9_9EUKA
MPAFLLSKLVQPICCACSVIRGCTHEARSQRLLNACAHVIAFFGVDTHLSYVGISEINDHTRGFADFQMANRSIQMQVQRVEICKNQRQNRASLKFKYYVNYQIILQLDILPNNRITKCYFQIIVQYILQYIFFRGQLFQMFIIPLLDALKGVNFVITLATIQYTIPWHLFSQKQSKLASKSKFYQQCSQQAFKKKLKMSLIIKFWISKQDQIEIQLSIINPFGDGYLSQVPSINSRPKLSLDAATNILQKFMKLELVNRQQQVLKIFIIFSYLLKILLCKQFEEILFQSSNSMPLKSLSQGFNQINI